MAYTKYYQPYFFYFNYIYLLGTWTESDDI